MFTPVKKEKEIETEQTARAGQPTQRIISVHESRSQSKEKQKISTRDKLNEELAQLLESIEPGLAMKYQGCQVEPKIKVTGGNKENQVQKRENTKVKYQARKKA